MAFGTPPAYMGFVGYVRFKFPSGAVLIRATSADVKLLQEITKPDTIDSRPDRSTYQLGPRIVEGSVEYPAIMERSGGNDDPTARLYKACTKRISDTSNKDYYGQLFDKNLDIDIKYTSQFAEFSYVGCLINTFRFSVAQSDQVKINCAVIGRDRVFQDLPVIGKNTTGFPRNARVVTWNDAIVKVNGARGAPSFDGQYVRSFEVTYNNNADRYYTLNGTLAPQDIAVKKRDIDGRLVLLGRHDKLGEHARSNEDRCFEETTIQYGYKLNRDQCASTFLVTLPNIVFRIEEMALTNDLFETTVQFHSFPEDLDLTTSEYLETGGSVV